MKLFTTITASALLFTATATALPIAQKTLLGRATASVMTIEVTHINGATELKTVPFNGQVDTNFSNIKSVVLKQVTQDLALIKVACLPMLDSSSETGAPLFLGTPVQFPETTVITGFQCGPESIVKSVPSV